MGGPRADEVMVYRGGMGRRRVLKGVADGTLGAFVGRNGGVGGYWAIGVLCRFALERGVSVVEIDVLTQEVRPAWELMRELVVKCRERLMAHLRAVGLWEAMVAEARIRVSFERTTREHAASVRYRCVVRILDDRGRAVERNGEGWCWVHDPGRERRSARGPRGGQIMN